MPGLVKFVAAGPFRSWVAAASMDLGSAQQCLDASANELCLTFRVPEGSLSGLTPREGMPA